MENSVNRTLFVEFYGLPGCGKSTISYIVASRLRSEGFLVDEPSYEVDHGRSTLFRKLKKLSVFFFWLVFHYDIFKKVIAIVKRNGYSGKSKIEQTSNVLQKIGVYQDTRRRRIVIWDQGLVQASISLSLCGDIKAEDNLMNLLHILNPNVKTLNVLITVGEEVALERMSQRVTNNSRVEKLKDTNQKHQMLKRFQDGVNSIRKQNTSHIIKGEDLIENQVAQITKEIIRNYV